MDAVQPKDHFQHAQRDRDIYQLRLYVVGSNKESQLAYNSLKEICSKYLAEKCHIEVIDLTNEPNLAREDQIIAIPTLIRKNYPGKRIIGDLSNQERVLELLDLRIDNFLSAANEKNYVEKTSTDESKTRIVKDKKSKYDLQPYIGSYLCRRLSQSIYDSIFSLS